MAKKSEEKKSVAKAVRVNKAGEFDEVFFQNEEPYENFAVYVEPGKYKEGDSYKESSPVATTQGNVEPVQP